MENSLTTPLKHIVIAGGGSAGWMSAALLAKTVAKDCRITLVESDEIGIVGVGEATIPPIQVFNKAIGLDEQAFIKQTHGTIKLGIQFENWGKLGDSYMHAFGPLGRDLGLASFHHYYLRAKQTNSELSLWDFSLNFQAAKVDKFKPLPQIPNTPLPGLSYAYHFDATEYAKYLRQLSENMGVVRKEGLIEQVNLDNNTGDITSLTLKSGETVTGDLFIDATGFRALLIEQALNTGYDDWSHYLPCNRALAMPTTNTDKLRPYTRSIAHDAGWQWQIPLQHRTGNGHVYCSDFISDEQAEKTLRQHCEGDPLADPRLIKFTTGKRKQLWHKNCVAVGLSSGFLEPLESTSLHLIQSTITKLVKCLPSKNINPALRNEFNRQIDAEFKQVRDFIILHYKMNQRSDSEFWRHCQSMDIPETLAHRIELFEAGALTFRTEDELFAEVAWQQVLLGQNCEVQGYSPLADKLSDQQLNEFLTNLRHIYQGTVNDLPMHKDFITQHAKSSY